MSNTPLQSSSSPLHHHHHHHHHQQQKQQQHQQQQQQANTVSSLRENNWSGCVISSRFAPVCDSLMHSSMDVIDDESSGSNLTSLVSLAQHKSSYSKFQHEPQYQDGKQPTNTIQLHSGVNSVPSFNDHKSNSDSDGNNNKNDDDEEDDDDDNDDGDDDEDNDDDRVNDNDGSSIKLGSHNMALESSSSSKSIAPFMNREQHFSNTTLLASLTNQSVFHTRTNQHDNDVIVDSNQHLNWQDNLRAKHRQLRRAPLHRDQHVISTQLTHQHVHLHMDKQPSTNRDQTIHISPEVSTPIWSQNLDVSCQSLLSKVQPNSVRNQYQSPNNRGQSFDDEKATIGSERSGISSMLSSEHIISSGTQHTIQTATTLDAAIDCASLHFDDNSMNERHDKEREVITESSNILSNAVLVEATQYDSGDERLHHINGRSSPTLISSLTIPCTPPPQTSLSSISSSNDSTESSKHYYSFSRTISLQSVLSDTQRISLHDNHIDNDNQPHNEVDGDHSFTDRVCGESIKKTRTSWFYLQARIMRHHRMAHIVEGSLIECNNVFINGINDKSLSLVLQCQRFRYQISTGDIFACCRVCKRNIELHKLCRTNWCCEVLLSRISSLCDEFTLDFTTMFDADLAQFVESNVCSAMIMIKHNQIIYNNNKRDNEDSVVSTSTTTSTILSERKTSFRSQTCNDKMRKQHQFNTAHDDDDDDDDDGDDDDDDDDDDDNNDDDDDDDDNNDDDDDDDDDNNEFDDDAKDADVDNEVGDDAADDNNEVDAEDDDNEVGDDVSDFNDYDDDTENAKSSTSHKHADTNKRNRVTLRASRRTSNYVFRGVYVLLTGFSNGESKSHSKRRHSKSMITDIVQSAGGQIIDTLHQLCQLLRGGGGANRECHVPIIIVCGTRRNTWKTLFSLVRGYSTVCIEWIQTCIKTHTIICPYSFPTFIDECRQYSMIECNVCNSHHHCLRHFVPLSPRSNRVLSGVCVLCLANSCHHEMAAVAYAAGASTRVHYSHQVDVVVLNQPLLDITLSRRMKRVLDEAKLDGKYLVHDGWLKDCVLRNEHISPLLPIYAIKRTE